MSRIVVALLFGGKSPEHEISIISAKAVAAHLDKEKYTLFPLYISRKGDWYEGNTAQSILDLDLAGLLRTTSIEKTASLLHSMTGNRDRDRFRFDFKQKDIGLALPVLHGSYGEDGKVQGLLEVFGIPYTGCDVQASAVAMDKEMSKICAAAAGLDVAEYMAVSSSDYVSDPESVHDAINERFSVPFFVKPAHLGSSVGISKVSDISVLPKALDTACRLDSKVLVETAINGREMEVAVLGNDKLVASPAGEIEPGGDFYDYTDKYISGTARLHIPAKIDPNLHASLKTSAIRAYKALGCSGMARVDFFVEEENDRIIFNEINTIPGFTDISMYPMLMEASGISFSELIDKLLLLALEKYSR